MIKFDSSSIYNRMLQKLQQDPNWNVIVNNSVVSALMKSTSEINAETARYAEYLFKESKWDTAQNPSSIFAMANMLGYQPKRKISAKGRIYVSADPRTSLVGKSVSSSFFKGLMSNPNSTDDWRTFPNNLKITTTSTVLDSKGNSYIALPTRAEKNKKVIAVDIIQGTRKSVTLDISTIRSISTSSKLDPYLYIPVVIQNCENADNTTSKGFLRVYVMYNNNSYKEYRIVDSLLLSSSEDYDVELYNDLYSQELFYLKFNNDSTRGPILDISTNTSVTGIRIDYIESLGEDGNILSLFENFTISDIYDESIQGISGLKLYGVNFSVITNGKNEESISEIKEEAPKFYINNYTAGTKEAYENTIANMEFVIGNETVRPSKVQVFGGQTYDEYGNVFPVTYVSFIADNLEDLVTSSINPDETSPYVQIDDTLNYYLAKLKSPQDTLKFIAPNYVAYSLGLTCTVNQSQVDDIASLEANIRNMVEHYYGPDSDYLDFGRNIYPSKIASDIMLYYPEITSITTEVEAIKKLNWYEAERKSPKDDSDASSTVIHTVRIPFNFDSLFLGDSAVKGFKDYRTGSGYVIRFDFMYKKPKLMNQNLEYHTSLFVKDGSSLRSKPAANGGSVTDAFYLQKDTSQSGIWPNNESELLPDYTFKTSISQLKESQQYYFRQAVYSDTDYLALTDESSQEYTPTISSYLTDIGAIDDYLIYFSSDYENIDGTIGDGWIELTFDPIYAVLTLFSQYDPDLRELLKLCPLASLKCGNGVISDTFKAFITAVNGYVDIYVSMRPVDSNLRIDSSTEQGGSTVLYIDSSDSVTGETNTNTLTNDKRLRMISVSCKYDS